MLLRYFGDGSGFHHNQHYNDGAQDLVFFIHRLMQTLTAHLCEGGDEVPIAPLGNNYQES